MKNNNVKSVFLGLEIGILNCSLNHIKTSNATIDFLKIEIPKFMIIVFKT